MGNGAIDDLPETLDHLHFMQADLLVIADGEREVSDFGLERILQKLESSGTNIQCWYVPPSFSSLNALIEDMRTVGPQAVIAFGNARTIDAAKYIMLKYSLESGTQPEWISVPTSPDADSVSSPFIFLDYDGKGEKFLGKISTPVAIIGDTAILARAPERQLVAGIGDLLSRQTSIWDWKYANRVRNEPISEFGTIISDASIGILLNKLRGLTLANMEAITVLTKAIIIAGFLAGFADDLRSCYGSQHMFAQALDRLEPGKALHGERVALGTLMMANLQGQDWRAFRETLQQYKLPTQSIGLGYKTSSVIKALMQASNYPSGGTELGLFTILGPGLTEEAAWSLAVKTGVLGAI